MIVGGESGPGARPMEADWVRDIRDNCLYSSVPFFFQAMGRRVQEDDGPHAGSQNLGSNAGASHGSRSQSRTTAERGCKELGKSRRSTVTYDRGGNQMQEIDSQRPEPIKFQFRNIGPVKDAELELGDLTVIAGRNNTGKTYLVYTLYGFLKLWESWPDFDDFVMSEQGVGAQFPDLPNIVERVIREGRASFSLKAKILDQQRKLVAQEIARTFSERGLPAVFSSRTWRLRTILH